MFFPPRLLCVAPLRACVIWMVFGLVAGSVARVSADPVINEFLAINSGDGLLDVDGDSSDWVEIFNTGAAAIDLEGYGLSDDSDVPLRWQFPAVSLGAGEYLVVFASGKDRAVMGEELHTNFSLSGDGEFLRLSDAGGASVSQYSPDYPEQRRDVSYGIPAGGDPAAAGYFLTPTPGAANDGEALSALVSAPVFSVKHGYFSEPFLLEISPGSAAGTVFYTRDGSVPTRLNGCEYRGAIEVGSTAIFRAVTLRASAVPSDVVTRSYLFPADIKNQPRMAQVVASAPAYAPGIEADLAALPALSLAMPDERFLGPDGIYTNFQERGRDAEVPVSVEYFDPEGESNGDGGFQIDAGIRIHGGQARIHEKKPMRLYFRSDYGAGRLRYPLFDGSRVSEFDRLVMRSCGHDGWAIDWGDGRNDLTETATYIRDEFLRRSEQEMGMLSPYGKFVHVFINGEYWGMYDLHERVDSAYFSSHRGGNEADWDVIEGGGSVREGETNSWNGLLGLGANGVTNAAQYAELEGLLDMDGFIDSMISRMWSGDHDWLGPVTFPIGSTGDNNRNWFGGRRSRGGAGDEPFYFFAWDAEISMGNDRFLGSGNHQLETDLTGVNSPNSPGQVYDGVRAYEEFQVKFADRIYRTLFNDGALTVARAQARWDALSDRVRGPVVAESARWGNIHGGEALTRDVEWSDEQLWVRDTFLPQRTGTVIEQFRSQGLYPDVEPPDFPLAAGGMYPNPVLVSLAAPGGQVGEIFYTLDGSDPRQAASVDLVTLVPENAPARALVPSVANGGDALGESWKNFDDPAGIGGWTPGPAAVGFETAGEDYRALLGIDVESEMFGINGTVYMRVEFDIADQASLDSIARLVLKMKYDDGFVAYLNGDLVARMNASANPSWDSFASNGQPDQNAVIFEEFDISAQIAALRIGRNVLALQGLNGSTESSDLLLVPKLQASGVEVTAGVAAGATLYSSQILVSQSGSVKTRFLSEDGEWSALREERFVIGDRPAVTGDLVVSEINYHPRNPDGAAEEAVASADGAFEFIEVMNVSGEGIEMGGVRFDDGIDFVFPAGSLQAGERLVVVADRAAFNVRYPGISPARVAGEFGRSLSNGGERIVLLDGVGGTTLDFTYDDITPWPTSPDGSGATLMLVAPAPGVDHSQAASWRASRLTDGAPGADENAFDLDIDGLPDDWERTWFGNLSQGAGGNPDGDGWDNAREFLEGTNPLSPDTDNDGLSDSAEEFASTDPTVRDSDGDGLTDGEEVLGGGSLPSERDTDGDGLDDGYEVLMSRTDPSSRDSDGDGSGDWIEVQRGSDPNDSDSIALAREDDFVLYASMDSKGSTGGGELSGDVSEVPGAIAGGLRLAAGSQLGYGQIGDPGATNLSAVLWVKLETSSGTRQLVSKGDAWRIKALDGAITLNVADLPPVELARGIETGSWHLLAVVFDREIGVVRGFFDGEQAASQVLGDSVILDSSESLVIGGWGDAAICADEFSLLQFPLHPIEVRAIYAGRSAGLPAVDVLGSGDSDVDGLPDDWERSRFGDLSQTAAGDPDSDGLSNREEFELGTNPGEADTDGDGSGDRDEVLAGSDPSGAGTATDVEDGLLIYSSFDGSTIAGSGTGARVFDLSMPPENGIASSAFDLVPGRVGGSVRKADGQINYGRVHDPGSGAFTASIWFQADRLEPGLVQRVVGKGAVATGGSSGWQILVIGDEVAVAGGDLAAGEFFLRGMPMGEARLQVGEWNHVGMVIERGAGVGRVRLFVNGAEIPADGIDDVEIADDWEISSETPLATHVGNGAAASFSGAVDELAIWGSPLSPGDMGALYRAGLISAGIEDLSGAGAAEVEFSVTPETVKIVLNPGETVRLDALLGNSGDRRANWFARLEFAEDLSLQTALDRIDAGSGPILDAIPFRFAFDDGVAGRSIGDGGQDMFDGGNMLNTDLETLSLLYSDGVVVESDAFGETGAYFTRKVEGGLFVLGADLDGVESFTVSGGLGADGAGDADGVVLSIERSGRRFLGFVKRVYDGVDPFSNVFDPSVNHLIIIEDNGLASHTFSGDTDSDFHRVSGMTGVRRLYHLLYASQEGLRISDADTLKIFETFVDTVGVAPGWLTLADEAGQVDGGGESLLGLNFDAGILIPGIEEGVLRVFSNDPDLPVVDVPIVLRINAEPSAQLPVEIAGDEDSGPFMLDLGTVFEDDGSADGEELNFELVSISGQQLVSADSTFVDGSELTVGLVQDASGVASVRVRATDPQGLFTETLITVRVAPVNDLPSVAGALEVMVDEDSGPVVVPLRAFFDDVEDGSAGLEFALRPLAPGALIGPPFLDEVGGQLMFGLVPDAHGVTMVPLRVSDSDGGFLDVEIAVVIREVADAPRAIGNIPGVVADEAANDWTIALPEYFRDPDTGDFLRYSIVGNTKPELFSDLVIDETSGELTVRFAPFVSGRAELTVRATDVLGLFADQKFEVVLPEIDVPGISIATELKLNRQTGLWEQLVTIDNRSQRDIGAVRLLVGGLANGVRVYNASGQSADGRAEVIYNRTLPAGASAGLTLEYFSEGRVGGISPEIETQVSLRQTTLTGGEAFAIDRVLSLDDGTLLVEFPAEPGALYIIQYSTDLREWKDGMVRLRAGGTRVQWIDRGAPGTDSSPAGEGGRFYRVLRVAD